MTKRCLVLLLVVGIFFAGCSKDEFYYEGKSASQWIKMLKDKDPEVRRSAAVALGNIGPKAPTVVPALIRALEDRDRVVRVQAIIALGEIGPPAMEAVPALTATLQDDDKWVSLHAVSALGKMGQGARDAVPALVAALKNPDRNVRLHAVGALGEMGPQAREAVPALIEALMRRYGGDEHPAAIEVAPGDLVEIADGPFAEFVARVEAVSPEHRVHLLIDLLGRETRMSVEPSRLRRAG